MLYHQLFPVVDSKTYNYKVLRSKFKPNEALVFAYGIDLVGMLIFRLFFRSEIIVCKCLVYRCYPVAT